MANLGEFILEGLSYVDEDRTLRRLVRGSGRPRSGIAGIALAGRPYLSISDVERILDAAVRGNEYDQMGSGLKSLLNQLDLTLAELEQLTQVHQKLSASEIAAKLMKGQTLDAIYNLVYPEGNEFDQREPTAEQDDY